MRNQTRLRKSFIIGGGALAVLILAVCGVWYARNGGTGQPAEQQEAAAETVAQSGEQELLYDTIEAGEVASPEYGAHTFINQSNPGATQYPGDKRKVFRIIEVIPHDICSLFPYLVDWGTPEEYDKNVPVGYEGLMAISRGSGAQMFYGKTGTTTSDLSQYYTMLDMAFKQTSLKASQYPYLTFGGSTMSDWGKWYIISDSSLSSADGYFEFVGNGKGLFYISTSYADEKSSNDEEGIHHRTRAVPRSGSEQPKGDMYLTGAAVYLSREHSRASVTYGQALLSQTADNYDLSFAVDDVNGKYHADMTKVVAKEGGPLIGYDWDYVLMVDEPDTWDYGFSYGSGGGYEVKVATENTLGTGEYIRVMAPAQDDAYTDVNLPALLKGYFRLKTSSDIGLQTYDVEFQAATGASSYYYPISPAGPFNNSDPSYHFEYVGDGKGLYHVPFIYDGGSSPGNCYTESLVEVSDGEGRYSMTSTIADPEGQPIYAQTTLGAGDYEEIITNIQFTTSVNASGTDNGRVGVTKGGADRVAAQYGGWVFHPVTDQADMELTPLRDVYSSNVNGNSNANFSVGDKIYVRGQQLQQRYYCRDGFENNEMFKLRGYASSLTHPGESYSLYGYNNNISPYENKQLDAAKTILTSFDATTRIEILQKTMAQLTVEDVKSADLIYISVTPAVENLDKSWPTINEWRVAAGLEPMEDIPSGLPQKQGMAYFPSSYHGDLSAEVMLAIYKECIYEKNVALMVPVSAFTNGNGKTPTSNIGKLVFITEAFNNPQDFAYFIPGLMNPDVYRTNYTKVNMDASLTTSGPVKLSWYWDTQYNQTWDESNTTHVTGAWAEKYFIVRNPSNSSQLLHPANFEQIPAGTNRYDGNEQTKLTLGEHGPQSLRRSLFFNGTAHLFEILSNRTQRSYTLEIVPINGERFTDRENNERWVIYGNEFDPASFEIQFQIWKYETSGTPYELDDISDIECSIEGGSPISAALTPVTEGGVSVPQYTINGGAVRVAFELSGTPPSGLLDPAIYSRKVTITVNDETADEVSREVEVIVREGFFLN